MMGRFNRRRQIEKFNCQYTYRISVTTTDISVTVGKRSVQQCFGTNRCINTVDSNSSGLESNRTVDAVLHSK